MENGNALWHKVFKIQNNIVYREIADEYILVPVSGELADMQRIFMLNPVAEFIWRQLDGIRRLSNIGGGVVRTFDVDKAAADADTLDFIQQLLDAGLIAEVN